MIVCTQGAQEGGDGVAATHFVCALLLGKKLVAGLQKGKQIQRGVLLPVRPQPVADWERPPRVIGFLQSL